MLGAVRHPAHGARATSARVDRRACTASALLATLPIAVAAASRRGCVRRSSAEARALVWRSAIVALLVVFVGRQMPLHWMAWVVPSLLRRRRSSRWDACRSRRLGAFRGVLRDRRARRRRWRPSRSRAARRLRRRRRRRARCRRSSRRSRRAGDVARRRASSDAELDVDGRRRARARSAFGAPCA